MVELILRNRPSLELAPFSPARF